MIRLAVRHEAGALQISQLAANAFRQAEAGPPSAASSAPTGHRSRHGSRHEALRQRARRPHRGPLGRQRGCEGPVAAAQGRARLRGSSGAWQRRQARLAFLSSAVQAASASAGIRDRGRTQPGSTQRIHFESPRRSAWGCRSAAATELGLAVVQRHGVVARERIDDAREEALERRCVVGPRERDLEDLLSTGEGPLLDLDVA